MSCFHTYTPRSQRVIGCVALELRSHLGGQHHGAEPRLVWNGMECLLPIKVLRKRRIRLSEILGVRKIFHSALFNSPVKSTQSKASKPLNMSHISPPDYSVQSKPGLRRASCARSTKAISSTTLSNLSGSSESTLARDDRVCECHLVSDIRCGSGGAVSRIWFNPFGQLPLHNLQRDQRRSPCALLGRPRQRSV